MIPQRLSVKFFLKPGTTVDLAPFTPLFHRFIQNRAIEGLLIDVADYKHVPEGPGVILIGHDVDYALDLAGGKPGLLVRRKRYAGTPVPKAAASNAAEDSRPLGLADILRDTLRKGLLAARAIQRDGTVGAQFDFAAVEVSLIDRLIAPNTDASFAEVRPMIQGVLDELFEGASLHRGDPDPRRNLSIVATARTPADLETLIDRLEPKAVSA